MGVGQSVRGPVTPRPWWLRLLHFGRPSLRRRLPDERIYLAPF